MNEMQDAELFRVLGNHSRLAILGWLKDPVAHFPPQVDGDLIEDGVCGQSIADKLGISASTLSEHMRLMVAAGFVVPKRIKQWTFYRRDEARLGTIASRIGAL
ncbi:MAG: winged helix-turn-helix domain-containing protein [Sphingomonas sp.]|nr:winged helix-turn-helix domain-containing protein [Sphingomonas sp.]